MGCVFINYRRGDTSGEARALFNELVGMRGKDSVFMDVDAIALGRDFREVVRERIETCDLVLALIGEEWLTAANSAGKRRLDDPNDFVRLEIASALKRDIPVIPVLVQGAPMPTPEQLPEEIRDFAYRNGFELSHTRWESDVQEMIKRLKLADAPKPAATATADVPTAKLPAGASVAPPPPQGARPDTDVQGWAAGKRRSRLMGIAGGALAIALTVGGVAYYRTVAEENARIEQLQQEKAAAEARAAAAEAERQRQAELEAEQMRLAEAEAERKRIAEADAERKRIAEAEAQRRRLEEAQSERERIARADAERKRRAEAEAERRRQEQAASEEKRRADAESAQRETYENRRKAAVQTTRFSGSLNVSLGTFARSLGIKQYDMEPTHVMAPCSNWAKELALANDPARAFRSICLRVTRHASQNGWPSGAQPDINEWSKFCSSSAGSLTGDPRRTFIVTCMRYR
ncbi:MAG: TIR domain-containing protein [Burkholderiales bacterium]